MSSYSAPAPRACFARRKSRKSGKRVAVIDHAATLGEKIRISGGGRCNFTNRDTKPENFISENPGFCRSALARYTPQDFIARIERHGIAWHEKHKGQLFCDGSAQQIVRMLLSECAEGNVEVLNPVKLNHLQRIESEQARYALDTSRGLLQCVDVVVATGGLSIPKIGASDLGYRIARQFDIPVVPTRPALVPLTIDAAIWAPFAQLSGVALQAVVRLADSKIQIARIHRRFAVHASRFVGSRESCRYRVIGNRAKPSRSILRRPARSMTR